MGCPSLDTFFTPEREPLFFHELIAERMPL